MSVSILRAGALALLAGIACTTALAQSSGNTEIDNSILQQLQPDGTIAPLPEEEQPVVRKRKQPGTETNDPPPAIDGVPGVDGVQPGPDSNALPPGIDGIPEGENPQPVITDQQPDENPRKRRRPQPDVEQPGPDTNGPTPTFDPIPEVDPQPLPRRRKPRQEFVEPGPGPDFAGPSADQIERQLDARPRIRLAPSERVTIREFERRPDLRRAAPSIDIQAINFTSGSAEIPLSQYRKVENIAIALDRLLRRDPETLVLIEGHTDAVGSFASNQVLSERRAISLKRVLVREFDIPREALETVGYGEEYLLVPTTRENWRNRRVTLRAIDDFVR